jgi:carotenoid 1,2-hydratase
VADGGYAWWYIDALSEDLSHGLVVIAFIGSVFSPYYARARRRAGPDAAADPLSHCAINVALYGPGRSMWAMTERGALAVARSGDALRIGPSRLQWRDDTLDLRIDEWSAPWARRLRGRIRVRPQALLGQAYALDAAGRHHWWPIAPRADVHVELDAPALRWQGSGYLDSNRGTEPLERAFAQWHWARAHLGHGRSAVIYEAQRRDGSHGALALRFRGDAAPEPFDAPPRVALPPGDWGVARATRCDSFRPPHLLQRLEDGPFYTRSLLALDWCGEPVAAMQESLDLDRFSRPWVQAMLPFRMPRRSGPKG